MNTTPFSTKIILNDSNWQTPIETMYSWKAAEVDSLEEG